MSVQETFEKEFNMKVAAKVIQLISSSIYRTPANALKELISNAFDADSPTVDITFGDGKFNAIPNEIRIEDKGKGIKARDFEFSMKHIGSSLKTIQGDETEKGRPIIGRIGIGLLSVGQVTNRFDIISATNDGKGMRAEIDLSYYFDALHMAESLDELNIGNIKQYKFENPEKKMYTKIILKDLKKPFITALFGEKRHKYEFDFDKVPSYHKFIEWVDENQIKRIETISPVNRFMFELGLLTPVKYFDEGPIYKKKSKIIDHIKERLINYDFKVFVNQVEIFKPIMFPLESDNIKNKAKLFKIYDKKIDIEYNNKKMTGYCYLYHQNVRIIPYELRGILVRYKNVGIGTYDNELSKISTESPIDLYQLTGEIYMDNGLDDALNIDRNSFFISDEMYQRLYLEIMAWTNPRNLPESSKELDLDISTNPVSSDIRKRMHKIRSDNKIKKDMIKREEILEKLSSIIKKEGYPTIKSPILEISYKKNISCELYINSINTTQTKINVNLNKKYNNNITNTIILLLTAQNIALKKSKNTNDFKTQFHNIIQQIIF